MNVSSFVELPADVRRRIIEYLSLTDVIRLGMTSKKMPDFTWPCRKDMSVGRDYPIEALFWVLSQDLSHIREMCLYYSRGTTAFAKDRPRIPALLEQIATLTKLTNLRSLSVDLVLQEENFVTQINSTIKNIVASLTQLQWLTWYSADVADCNFGEVFGAHTRLTLFSTHSKQELCGINQLTQVQSLSLPFCEQFDDQTMTEACQLKQLTSLSIYYNDKITDESFTKITNLTNLERLSMNHAPGIKSTSFHALAKLPKLTDLMLNYPWDSDQAEYSATLAIIGQLPHLTRLQLSNYQGRIDFQALTDLTTLLELDLDSHIETADFSSLSKLTKLVLRPKTSFILQNLPSNLRDLDILSFRLTDDAIDIICSLEELSDLQLRNIHYDEIKMGHAIKKLTKLANLTIIPHPPVELLPSLRALPNLVHLMVSEVPSEMIRELSLLTQLMELTYCSKYNKELKHMVPFSVDFVGDPDDSF